jgi:uncharacterized membrane protein
MHQSWLHQYANAIGIVGVVLVLTAYMLLQLHKMSAHGLSYTTINAVGSILILVSLYYHLNIAALVIEIAWLIISAYGMYNAIQKRN